MKWNVKGKAKPGGSGKKYKTKLFLGGTGEKSGSLVSRVFLAQFPPSKANEVAQINQEIHGIAAAVLEFPAFPGKLDQCQWHLNQKGQPTPGGITLQLGWRLTGILRLTPELWQLVEQAHPHPTPLTS